MYICSEKSISSFIQVCEKLYCVHCISIMFYIKYVLTYLVTLVIDITV